MVGYGWCLFYSVTDRSVEEETSDHAHLFRLDTNDETGLVCEKLKSRFVRKVFL